MKGQVGQKMQLKGMYSLSGIGRNFVRGVFLKKKSNVANNEPFVGKTAQGSRGGSPQPPEANGVWGRAPAGVQGTESPVGGLEGEAPRASFWY